jgi:Tol biopolymer transport system component
VFVHSLGDAVTWRASSGPHGEQGAGESYMSDFSGNGRFVAFSSLATFTPNDTNGASDDYVKDRRTGAILRVSVGTGGIQANGPSYGISLSEDGRYAVFSGYASNLVPNDTNGNQDVFMYDILMNVTTLLSVSTAGVQGNGENAYAQVSDDGRVTVFVSDADNLYPFDNNFARDVFVRQL